MLRPVNGLISKQLRQGGNRLGTGYKFFEWCGNRANGFEVRVNRLLVGHTGLGQIEDLHPELAFNKGVDYFTEVFFFYGLVFGIVFYEMHKSIKAAEYARETQLKLIERTEALQAQVGQIKARSESLKLEIAEIESSHHVRQGYDLVQAQRMAELERKLDSANIRVSL